MLVVNRLLNLPFPYWVLGLGPGCVLESFGQFYLHLIPDPIATEPDLIVLGISQWWRVLKVLRCSTVRSGKTENHWLKLSLVSKELSILDSNWALDFTGQASLGGQWALGIRLSLASRHWDYRSNAWLFIRVPRVEFIALGPRLSGACCSLPPLSSSSV